ncbi:RHS repeat-associated core domain-containing protein [Chryseobacterium arthrosphaerae]|nr:RHS repeat-associated core domain-containing protein [Chryseobacterium arthrosphaerae]
MILGLLFTATVGYAQSTSENYIQSGTCLNGDCSKKTETITYYDGLGRAKQIVNVKATATGKDLVTPVVYDGAGRQTKDILPVPVSSLNAAIHTGIVNENTANSYYGVANAYAEKEIENSPLDRILQQAHPGDDWKMGAGHTVKYRYEVNESSEVKKFLTITTTNTVGTVTNTESSVPFVAGNIFYDAGTLYKNTVTDEDGTPVTQFQNGRGQVVLIRRSDGIQNTDTYYVYNEYGQQAFVIPPKAVQRIEQNNNTVTQNILNELCYQYRYDGQGRLVEKRLPGKDDWEFIVYDAADRPVLTQDPNLKSQGLWMLTKYDSFGRIAYTGLLAGGSRAGMQAQIGNQVVSETQIATGFNRNGLMVYYTNAFFSNFSTVLTIHYYDFYPRDTKEFPPAKILNQYVINHVGADNGGVSTLSMPTAVYTKNIENDNWTRTYFYYDTKGRMVGNQSWNHLGGYTKTESELDFTGNILRTATVHKRKSDEVGVTVKERFVYDDQNRVKYHYHQVNSQPEELLAENTYNDLSQLINKKVGNNLQSIDYTYNIRGWMTDINKDQMGLTDLGGKLFSYKIKYNQMSGITNPDPVLFPGKDVKPRYNGNIAEVDWRSVETPGVYPSLTPKRYGYVYDSLNRITAGFYQNPLNPFSKENTESLAYDANGNITHLYRTSVVENGSTIATKIDDLTYTYNGNRTFKIKDASSNSTGYEGTSGYPFSYDANGNMISIPDKQITEVKYNHLNLPEELVFDFGNLGTYSNSLYRADGIKLKKTNTSTVSGFNTITVTTENIDYLDGFQYYKKDINTSGGGGIDVPELMTVRAFEPQAFSPVGINSPIGTVSVMTPDLQFFPTSEGFYDYPNSRYIYQYKDHLGNVRVSFEKNLAGGIDIVDNNDYYPFGMNHLKTGNAYFGQNSFKKYKYNGKELQETGMYDYGARMYMPDLGRWGVVDPLAEKMTRHSPYNYAFNNPLRFIDPDGREPKDDFIFNQHGKFVRIDKKNQPDKLVIENSKTGARQNYRFSDPVNDTKDIRSGVINTVVFVNKNQIKSMLNQQGAFDPDNKNNWSSFYRESKGGHKFDYSYSVIPSEFFSEGASSNPLKKPSPMLFIPEGDDTAQNHMNFGNYLWAASGYTLGFDYSTLQMAGHANSLINSKSNGYKSQWDSADDQKSIIKGANYSSRNSFRAILEKAIQQQNKNKNKNVP